MYDTAHFNHDNACIWQLVSSTYIIISEDASENSTYVMMHHCMCFLMRYLDICLIPCTFGLHSKYMYI